MAFTFPASPATNDTYTVGSRTYTWTGSVWEMTGGLITTSQLTDLGVTTAKINDAAVTQAKLGTTLSAVTVTTTANRDTAIASPFTGQLVFLTDTKKVQVWDGASWLNITLAPPETPTSLSATALGTTSVSIAFTAGGANGSPITNYQYALSTNGGSTYGSFTALSPEDITTPITISGLTEATAYYIKLKAVNDLGDSVASSAVTITTLDIPDAPTSLSAGSITATTVVISFTPGAQGGSAISNYQYALSTNGGSTYGSFTALSPADAASPISITGLTANSSYYVKIKAVNNDGAGVESSAVSFTTLLPVTTSVEYLVVGGGASYGPTISVEYFGGGGGAGRVESGTLAVASSTPLTVTIGAGGTGSGGGGGTSVFSSISSVGGSAGSSSNGGTSGNGFGGGSRAPSGYGSGAGGGSTGSGGSASNNNGASGGAGTTSSISGSSVLYSKGGGTLNGYGGGSYGTGGGVSAGGSNVGGTAGVVIFRYADSFAAASSTTGSPTITVAGGYRVYQFTANGTVTF